MENFQELLQHQDEGLRELAKLWKEIGFDEENIRLRKHTVLEHFDGILSRMIQEEKNHKAGLLDSLERNTLICEKLKKEMGISVEDFDCDQSLIELTNFVKKEALRLKKMKEDRMVEVLKLKRQDEELCTKLCMDPFYSTTVPTTAQLEGLKDHIKRMDDEKYDREEKFMTLKDNILKLYEELEHEPISDFEREIACEDAEYFILSSSNLSKASEVLKMLENQVKAQQKEHMLLVEKIENLYERLRMDMTEKYKFLSVHQGHGKSVLADLKLEIERLEEIKKANIEKFIINLRNELHDLWDKCFYSKKQRDDFLPLHSIDFNEELLDQHEAEVERMKEYHSQHKDLFLRVSQREEVWSKFIELERRAKDPTRLMNSRGNQLLIEEKERNKVNKALPRIEQELFELIDDWEQEHGKVFMVEGVCFSDFIAQQKEDHCRALEEEKNAKERAKREAIMHETRYGAKPSTPAKLRNHNTTKTPGRAPPTPVQRMANNSRLVRKVSSAMATIRSPRAGKIAKGISPRLGGTAKTKKMVAANEKKLKKGILSQSNYTLVNKSVIRGHDDNTSMASTVPDYANFKEGARLNSTEAMAGLTPEVTRNHPSYMTPTASSSSRTFKTPSASVSRSRLGTPKSYSKSTPQLSRLRSGKNLPMLF